jgi:hypothetical protein
VLEAEPLTTDNGMLTPTLKVKRRNVVRKYEERLRALYDDVAELPAGGRRRPSGHP